MKLSFNPNDPNVVKDAVGYRSKNGTRYCEKCAKYKPHHNTVARKPWWCRDCKMVQK